MLEQNTHYQTHQRRYDEFQQFDPPSSFTREPSKLLLKSANTTSAPITIGNENTTFEAPAGNEKVCTKSIKAKEKVILVGDSIASGINGKDLSTDKFATVVLDIPGATSDDMVHHTIPFAERNPIKLIAHPGTKDICSNIYRNHWKLRKNI